MEQCMITWTMVLTIIGINIAIAGILGGFSIWAFSKLDSDVKSSTSKLDSDIKAVVSSIDAQSKAQTARTDKLYQMFIDLLKEQKPKTHP